LVKVVPSGRYDLHELLRQFAADKLADTGERDAISHRHFQFCLSLAEQAEAHLYSPEQVAWLDRLDTNHDNLRAALAWSLLSGQAELGLRLAASLEWFWHMRPSASEGREWLIRLLEAAPGAAPFWRAKALHCAANLTNLLPGKERAEEAKALCEQALV